MECVACCVYYYYFVLNRVAKYGYSKAAKISKEKPCFPHLCLLGALVTVLGPVCHGEFVNFALAPKFEMKALDFQLLPPGFPESRVLPNDNGLHGFSRISLAHRASPEEPGLALVFSVSSKFPRSSPEVLSGTFP